MLFSPGCACCSTSTITITVFGCNGLSIVADVDMILGGVTVNSGTTSGQVNTVTRTAAGSGYTNGTGFALAFSGGGGSGAAGTFNVASGAVTAITLTNSGTGYTSAPAVSFAAAGGTGATATVTIVNRVTLSVASSGSYTFNATETLTGRFQTGTLARSLTLPTTTTGSITLSPATAYVCFQCSGFAFSAACAYPVKKVLNVTVPGGSGTATFIPGGGGGHWEFAATIASVPTCDPTPGGGTGSITFTHSLINAAGLGCMDVTPRGLCGGAGTGCTFASDAFGGTTGASSSSCTTSSAVSITCPGPASIFTATIASFTYWSNVANTVPYFSGAITWSE